MERAAADISSAGGRNATHLLISVLETSSYNCDLPGGKISPSARSVLVEFTKHITALDPLLKTDSSRSKDIVARCQRRALSIVERALALDSALEPNRALLRTNVEDEKQSQENSACFVGDALAA